MPAFFCRTAKTACSTNLSLICLTFCIKFSQKEVGEVRYQNADSKSELNFSIDIQKKAKSMKFSKLFLLW